ncbi:MAG: polynucleotide adenylyltransferase PcnB [Planctomycetota bacterium]|jgi:poly(A) polymerase
MQEEKATPAPQSRIPRSAIDEDAYKVIRRLKRHGFKAYLVGGCVRDLLLGLEPKDFDIATSARPRQIKRLFRNSRIIGRRFRLAHIRFGEKVLEVATFRAPPDAEDTDDPYIKRDNVFGDEESDAFRRDFTINALFYDPEERKVIDHVGGLPDLDAKRLRSIGPAEMRLREDPVRSLRAAKFAGRLEFHPDEELDAALRSTAPDLAKASNARILEEFYRLVSGRGSRRTFELLQEWGCLPVILPEVEPLPDFFLEALGRVEDVTRGSRSGLSQGLMIAVLLSPLAVRALHEKPVRNDHEAEVLLGDVLRDVCVRLTVARRDSTLARQCLAAQVRFLSPPVRKGSRRFCFRPYFRDAATLRGLLGPLEPVPEGEQDPFDRWVNLSRDLGASGGKPPRRRRRRRRRKKKEDAS